MNQKQKERFKKCQEEHKILDNLHFLIAVTQNKIIDLLNKEEENTCDNISLAAEIFILKALGKVSIVESLINKMEEE